MITNVQALPARRTAAPLAPAVRAWAQRTGQTVWRVLQAVGAARARKELNLLAISQQQINPELAAQLRRVVREDWLSRG